MELILNMRMHHRPLFWMILHSSLPKDKMNIWNCKDRRWKMRKLEISIFFEADTDPSSTKINAHEFHPWSVIIWKSNVGSLFWLHVGIEFQVRKTKISISLSPIWSTTWLNKCARETEYWPQTRHSQWLQCMESVCKRSQNLDAAHQDQQRWQKKEKRKEKEEVASSSWLNAPENWLHQWNLKNWTPKASKQTVWSMALDWIPISSPPHPSEWSLQQWTKSSTEKNKRKWIDETI